MPNTYEHVKCGISALLGDSSGDTCAPQLGQPPLNALVADGLACVQHDAAPLAAGVHKALRLWRSTAGTVGGKAEWVGLARRGSAGWRRSWN